MAESGKKNFILPPLPLARWIGFPVNVSSEEDYPESSLTNSNLKLAF
jgi:hypothetical protein